MGPVLNIYPGIYFFYAGYLIGAVVFEISPGRL